MYLRCEEKSAQVYVLQGDFQQQAHEARQGDALERGAPGKTLGSNQVQKTPVVREFMQ
jgi:hypothetical protein